MSEPIHCRELTYTTKLGLDYDWSVPRQCNRPMGHQGDHVYDFDKGRSDQQK